MSVTFKILRAGERLDLANGHESLDLVLGWGRATSLCTTAQHSQWLAIAGDLHLDMGEGATVLPAGSYLTGEGRIRGTLRNMGAWAVLSGSNDAWRLALERVLPGVTARDPLFYPDTGTSPRQLKRALIGLLQACRRNRAVQIPTRLDATVFALCNQQSALEELSHRCTGRTAARRRQNLMRLIRVRHRIAMNPTTRIQLASLADGASYSPWHLIRTFRDVFGEAPCEFGMRVRLEHARRLIRTSRMSIAEVADAVGYDSRSAFCRSFRQAYGISATQIRSASRAEAAASGAA